MDYDNALGDIPQEIQLTMEWKAGAPLLSINDLLSLLSTWKGTLGSLRFIGPEFSEHERRRLYVWEII